MSIGNLIADYSKFWGNPEDNSGAEWRARDAVIALCLQFPIYKVWSDQAFNLGPRELDFR